jgi:hypothetical protein
MREERRRITPRFSLAHWWIQQERGTQRMVLLLIGLAGIVLVVCAVAGSIALVQGVRAPASTVTPSLTSLPSPLSFVSPPISPPTMVTPTSTPVHTPTPTHTPVPPTSTSTPTPTHAEDAQADWTLYNSGEPVETAPPGTDIQTANIGDDLRFVLSAGAQGAPPELAEWVKPDEMLFWMRLYKPVPDPPVWYTEWLFAVDLDGDVATGRPAGSARINPDLGMEAAIGAYYDPAEEAYATYFVVWHPESGFLTLPEEPRLHLDESRTLIGLALPLERLTQSAADVTGVTAVPDAATGRAAALITTDEQKLIDFIPERPD